MNLASISNRVVVSGTLVSLIYDLTHYTVVVDELSGSGMDGAWLNIGA
jgi:hypothetical protein